MNISSADFLIADGPYDSQVIKSILNNIEDRPQIKLYTEDEVTKAFQSQQLDWQQIKKARDISQLTPIRRRVVNKNGTAYMKTVYVKKQDINDSSKSRRFIEQDQLQQTVEVGDRVNVRFKGWSTGSKYTTDKVEVTAIEDDKIKLKFTQDFHTNNQNNYIFTQGSELVIPTTSNKSWNEHMSISKYQPPQPQPQTSTQQKTLVQSIDQISVGDNVSVMMRGGADDKIGQISYIHLTGDFIDIKIDQRKVRRKLGRFSLINQQPSQQLDREMVQRLEQIPNVSFTSLSPDQIRVPTHSDKQIGTEEFTVTVRVDQFGNENPRGGSHANRTRTRPKFYKYTEQEREQLRQQKFEQSVEKFNQSFGQFDFEQYVNETRDILKQTLDDSNPSIKFNINQHGAMFLEVRSSGLVMKRQFSPPTISRSTGEEMYPKRVYHALFTLSKANQGTGIGKKLLKSLYKQYKKAEIKQISVTANIDIGGYAWGRYGFTTSKNTARQFVRRYQEKVGTTYRGQKIEQQHATKASEVFHSFYHNNPSTKDFPMNLLCCIGQDNNVARAILKRTNWSGKLDITDTAQRTHFENYIGFSD